MPASIWARVPQKTSSMLRTNSTTVSRSEASGVRTRLSRGKRSGWRRGGASGGGSGGATAGAGGVAWIEVLLIGGSCASGEADGLDERLEGGFLFLQQLGRPLHREGPDGAAARQHHAEDARVVGRVGVEQIDEVGGLAVHLDPLPPRQALHLRGAELGHFQVEGAPAVDVGEQVAGLPEDGDAGGLVAVADGEGCVRREGAAAGVVLLPVGGLVVLEV